MQCTLFVYNIGLPINCKAVFELQDAVEAVRYDTARKVHTTYIYLYICTVSALHAGVISLCTPM
jgi:hypothetical protein